MGGLGRKFQHKLPDIEILRNLESPFILWIQTDIHFLASTSYEIGSSVVSADVKRTNDRKLLQSIFGNIDEFNLHLEGTPEYDEFILQGHLIENPSMRLEVKLTRRAELP